eukprot:CAMPEP_0197489048 /NCGR_PEP_ID=MMETSP1311-20131121/3921_1 /TAXON_ID=464262 /ORGANISM="Genus nov. species nov., Strain RCC856" /LENGTH=151 /DNA_ID=CAMNT_0043033287 /DNA_START=58 /DNA_END=513 /DNA_ORIENTATION=-
MATTTSRGMLAARAPVLSSRPLMASCNRGGICRGREAPLRVPRTRVQAAVEERSSEPSTSQPEREPAAAKKSVVDSLDLWSSDDLSKVGEAVSEASSHFFNRYDFLSTGTGAMCVTTYCVLKGQSPLFALSISVTATVVALVINELMEENV